MKEKKKSEAEAVRVQWKAATAEFDGERTQLGIDYAFATQVVEIDSLVRDLRAAREPLYVLSKSDVAGRRRVVSSGLGERMIACLCYDTDRIKECFSNHKFSPLFELFADLCKSTGIKYEALSIESMVVFNEFALLIAEQSKLHECASIVENTERCARKNAASLMAYIDKLQTEFSRLLVVRVDLGFSTEYRAGTQGKPFDIRGMKNSFARYLRSVARELTGLIGYTWKLEYGALKSYHYHVMLMFNGHVVREDESLGVLAGKIWSQGGEVGERTFWNCNHAEGKERYKQLGMLGIGMIDYKDEEMSANLRKAALYLTKVDYYVRLTAPDFGRTFGKGSIKACKRRRSGRPRRLLPIERANVRRPGFA